MPKPRPIFILRCLAMAIVLDRSGSMAVTVKGGKTKMDLADLGTAE